MSSVEYHERLERAKRVLAIGRKTTTGPYAAAVNPDIQPTPLQRVMMRRAARGC
jgi:hypothetical protein